MAIKHAYLYTSIVPLKLQQGNWAQKLEMGGVTQIVWIKETCGWVKESDRYMFINGNYD